MKKREVIEKKINEFHQYAINQKFPYIERFEEMRKKYSIEQLVGLIERFIIPAVKEDCLQEYLICEFERYKMVSLLQGNANDPLRDYVFTDEHKAVIKQYLEFIVKVIEL